MSLLDKASLIVTPNAYKASKLYSVIPTSGAGDMNVARATTATRVNSAGLIEVVPRNLVTYSQDFSNAAWVKSNSPTMTYNSAIAPNGTMTASGIKSNDATNYKSINQTISSISPNSTFTYSIYVKKETSETFFGGISVYLSGGTAKVFYGIVNAVNGTVTIASSSITPTIQVISEGNYWRIIATATDTGSNTSILAEYYATFSQNGTSLSTGIGSVRTIWGFQLEQGTTATEYFPTTTRLNIPRIDYTNGSCPSLLVEPQRTNLLTYSEQFDDASWAKTNMVIVANNTISPNGTNSADKATASSYPSTSITKTNLLTAASYTSSIYVKADTVSTFRIDLVTAGFALGANCIFNLSTLATTITNYGATTGTTAKIENVGNGWYRCSLTVSATAVVYFNQFYPAANGSVFIWGAQLELGSFATSYVPTVASSVTRNADVISKTGISSLIGQTEGTIFIHLKNNSIDATTKMILKLWDGTENNRIQLSTFADVFFFFIATGGTTQINLNYAPPILTNNKYKVAIKYASNSFKVFINGANVITNTSLSVPSTSALVFGNNGLSGLFNSINIDSTQLYKTALTDAECIALTTI